MSRKKQPAAVQEMNLATRESCADLAAEMVHGPSLFDKFGHPTEALAKYTGKRVLADTERCVLVGAFRVLGYSDRKIAEAVKCDVRSIGMMIAEAEKTGRIPALKDRLARLIGENTEKSQIVLAELLDKADGETSVDLAAMIKAVGTVGGIGVQNFQLLTGGATERIELKVGAARAEIEAWQRENAVWVEAIDCESTEKPATIGENEGDSGRDTGNDTAKEGQPAQNRALGEPAAGMGGGSAPGQPGGGDDGKPQTKIMDEVPHD